MEINPILNTIKDLTERSETIRGIFDYDQKHERLIEVNRELEDPNVWNKPEYAQELGRERAMLAQIVETLDEMSGGLADCRDLLDMAVEEDDEAAVEDVVSELDRLRVALEKLEFRRMFSGEMDMNNAYLDIQAGSGGTEAQDWANILLRMYLRWADKRGFDTTIMELSEGEVAGIKGATLHIKGEYAFGWLRTEIGVHRLVRKSPFDSGNRRHTSFSAVFVSPRSMTRSKSISTRPTCESIPIVRPVPVVSTLTPPTRRCGLPTSRPTPWSAARTNAPSTPTRTPP